MADQVRQLKIKTGSVKRLQKELILYEKEHDKEVAKVEKMKAENAEPHDLKHAVSDERPNHQMHRLALQRCPAASNDESYAPT
jgi:tubulin-specific chaperone A